MYSWLYSTLFILKGLSLSLILSNAAPYSSPRNVSAVILGSTSVSLTWLPPQIDLINGVLRYYHVLVSDLSEKAVYDILEDGNSLEALVPGLQPFSVYHCMVAAVTISDGPPATVVIQTSEDSTLALDY